MDDDEVCWKLWELSASGIIGQLAYEFTKLFSLYNEEP